MTETATSTPCASCPFLRTSRPGWLGEHEGPEELTQIVLAQQDRFPCHKAVNAIMGDEGKVPLDRAAAQARTCTGALAYAANACSMPRDPHLSAEVREVGRRADVFSNPTELHAHHHQNDRARH